MCKKLLTIIVTLIIFSSIFLTANSQASTPSIYINPQQSTVGLGETFSINISIAQVSNLTAWELKLFYLNTILNGTKATEGPFLKTAGSTFFWIINFTDNYNATHGFLHTVCSLTGKGPGATGSGTLATVTFKAKGGGTTTLTLSDTKLLDAQDPPQQIAHTTIDGSVQVIGIKDIAVLNVRLLKTIVGQGYTTNINVTLANQGDYTETFNITIYANTTIQTRQVTLANKTSTTITCTWNTIGYTKGNYTLWAYAWPVQGETDTADNTLSGGWVIVAMVGDLTSPNGWPDGKVDARDIALVCKYFGWMPYKPRYNPNTDINNDGKTDAKDIGIVCKQFGKKDP